MASIRRNGVTRQSGAGPHARKGEPGRARTRSAVRDAAVTDQLGTPARTNTPVEDLTDDEQDTEPTR